MMSFERLVPQTLLRSIDKLGKSVWNFRIRLRYLSSCKPNNHPERLAESALVHSAAMRNEPIILAFAYSVPVEKLDRHLRDFRVAGLVTKDVEPDSYLPDHLLNDRRLGRYWEQGAWSIPEGSNCIYFIGQWRLVMASMLRQALQHEILHLYIRCGAAWVDALALVRAADQLGLISLCRLGRRLRHLFFKSSRECDATQLRQSFDGAFRDLLKPPLLPIFKPVTKRIVLVTGSLAPGGAERQVANTVVGLASKPAESVLLLCDYLTAGKRQYNFFLPQVRAAGCQARQIVTRVSPEQPKLLPPCLKRVASRLPSGLVADVANLYWEFSEMRPEVVHAWLDWSNIRAGIAAALAGVPKIILSGRNLNPSHFDLYDLYMEPAYRVLASLPNVTLLNNSQAGADDYANWIGILPERIRVLRNGIDFGSTNRPSDQEIAELRRRHGIPEHAFVVGGAFRLAREKQPLLWVETAALVRQQIPEAYFILFGQGPMQKDVEAMSRSRKIADRLVLAGVTDQILSGMSMMDIFMLTSFGEGLPNVVLEAQWVGTPVVATEAGGTGEAVNRGVTGWIVEQPTANALAAQICRLYAARQTRLSVREAGPAFVRSHFGLARMIDETWAAYGYAPAADSNECRLQ